MRWLYIAALASMLILLGTVLIVVRKIRIKQKSDGGLDEPKFALNGRKKFSTEALPVIQTPIASVSALQPVAARTPGMRRPVRKEFESHRPKSGAMLLGMLAGAAILMLTHTQKRGADLTEKESDRKDADE